MVQEQELKEADLITILEILLKTKAMGIFSTDLLINNQRAQKLVNCHDSCFLFTFLIYFYLKTILGYSSSNNKNQYNENREKKTFTPQDNWSILGVSKTATKEEIRKAYRKLCLENHPGEILLRFNTVWLWETNIVFATIFFTDKNMHLAVKERETKLEKMKFINNAYHAVLAFVWAHLFNQNHSASATQDKADLHTILVMLSNIYLTIQIQHITAYLYTIDIDI